MQHYLGHARSEEAGQPHPAASLRDATGGAVFFLSSTFEQKLVVVEQQGSTMSIRGNA